MFTVRISELFHINPLKSSGHLDCGLYKDLPVVLIFVISELAIPIVLHTVIRIGAVGQTQLVDILKNKRPT